MKRTSVVAGLLMVFIMVDFSGAQVGNTVGNFMFRGNPENLNGRTVTVPDTMVAMAEWFWSTASRDSTIVSSEMPSIFFIIDNSGSMMGNGGNDPSGLRFSLAGAFIDTIQAKYPHAEVGIAVFGSYLWFDPVNDIATHPYFTRCVHPPALLADTGIFHNSAYVPLLKLDSIYYYPSYPAWGAHSGYDILKSILATAGNAPNVTLAYQPTNATLRGSGGNMTAGFDAAKCAMATARASRCSQYVLFFSDGNATGPDYDALGNPTGRSLYFRDSVMNVPTTFTVFFPAGNVPASIQAMTNNIRVNGYDPYHSADSGCTNRSYYWSSNSANLMSLLTSNIWKIITISSQQLPQQITINGQTSTVRSGDTAFQFYGIPLTGQITPVHISLVYNYYKDGLFVGDSTVAINYNIQTLPHLNSAWNPPRDSFDIWTWDRSLDFRYANAPIAAIADSMDSVQLYFTFDSGTAKYGYDNGQVNLYNKTNFTQGAYPLDHETVTLGRVSDNSFSAKFKRAVATVANPGDGVLQYVGTSDSIVAVFRNRENQYSKVSLPLDTLRKSIGLSAVTTVSPKSKTTLQPYAETWSISPINNSVRVHFPGKGVHSVKIYTLAGNCVYSQSTGEESLSVRLPKGVFIVNLQGVGSGRSLTKKIVAGTR
jgi:hypothetical protein